jgi:hypothetical protein
MSTNEEGERKRRVTELMRESARYVLAHDDGFYSRREIWNARRYLAETEPLPDAWAGKLPTDARLFT